MFATRDIRLLIVGILLVGVGWFFPWSARFGGVLMLIGAAIMLVAQYRMIYGRHRRR